MKIVKKNQGKQLDKKEIDKTLKEFIKKEKIKLKAKVERTEFVKRKNFFDKQPKPEFEKLEEIPKRDPKEPKIFKQKQKEIVVKVKPVNPKEKQPVKKEALMEAI